MTFFPKNKFILKSIIPVILVLQSNYRRKNYYNQFQLFKRKLIILQRFLRTKFKKEFSLPKNKFKQFKKTKKINKYFTIFVNIEQLAIDIQKNVRRFLVRKENEMQPTIPYSCYDDDLSTTEYSSEEEEEEENENKTKNKLNILDPRLYNIQELLTKFFTKYNPSKLSNIPIVVDYINSGNKSFESIQASLMKKYNANLNNIIA